MRTTIKESAGAQIQLIGSNHYNCASIISWYSCFIVTADTLEASFLNSKRLTSE